MALAIVPLTAEQVRTFISWEYAGPYAVYNIGEAEDGSAVAYFLDPANGYFAIVDTAEGFLGFCNFGFDARVPGGAYSERAVDIGMGMRPDLTGQGNGAHYAAAVFDFAEAQYPGEPQRVTIAEFNKRAQRLCSNFGFVHTARFAHERDGRPFVIMMREIEA